MSVLKRASVASVTGTGPWAAARSAGMVFLVAAAAASGQAGAEPAGAGEGGVAALQEELRWLAAERLVIPIPTVVGASRFEQTAVKAPASVSVITRDQIKKYGYRTLAEALRSLRSFSFSYDRLITYLGIRGFNDTSDINTRVLLLVDGHRMNENVFDAATSGTEFPLDIDLIDRIEVVRGPASALYGSNAALGLVNVITRKGSDLKNGEVSASYGSFDAVKGRLTCGHFFENGTEFLLSGTYFDSQGPEELYFPAFDDPATNYGIAEHDGDKHSSFFGKVSFLDFTLSGAHGKRDKDDPTGQFDVIFNDPRTNNQETRSYLDLRYEHTFGEDWDVTARVFRDKYVFKWMGPDVLGPMFFTEDDGEWWGTELFVTKPLLDQHTVTAGVEFRDNFRQDLDTNLRKDSNFWAVFAQDEFEILDNLILNAGVRYDRYSTFGGSVNPRAALIYNPFSKTVVKFLYGEAFRAPTAFELYYDSVVLTGNPDLDPETLRTYEVTLEQYLGKNYRLILAGFRNEIEDVILSQSVGAASQYRNRGSLQSQGIELELEGAWENGIEGRVSYSYQQAENEETGFRLANSPWQLAKLNLVLPLVTDKLFCGTEVLFVDDRKTNGGGTLGQYWLTNLTVFSRKLIGDAELSVNVYNLFDKRFEDVASEDHLNVGIDAIEQDGRTFRVEVTYRF